MSRRRLVRYGGLAAMLGGVLFAVMFAASISINAASTRTWDGAFVGTHAIVPMLDVLAGPRDIE